MGILKPEELAAHYAELTRKQPPQLDREMLDGYLQRFLNRRDEFVLSANGLATPLFLIDKKQLASSYQRFISVFSQSLPRFEAYYALKSNSNPDIVVELVKSGAGLDVSSGAELELALISGCRRIIFSGPGKTEAELKRAVANAGCVTVLMDSFGELVRLERAAGQAGVKIRSGVRLTTLEQGVWRKFGIPLARLADFQQEAGKCHWVDLRGLHFHTSWNLGPEAQVAFIRRLGQWLRQSGCSIADRLEFIDIGGGYWPEDGEWLQEEATPLGTVHQALEAGADHARRYVCAATTLDHFARELAAALKEQIPAFGNLAIYAEPGRWISHGAMHLLVRVLDKKTQDMVITDGGIHMTGWERFEHDFVPLINLSRPSTDEHACLVCGSLCTPHDVWGWSYFGAGIEDGDLLLIPDQGAYTYSLRQKFIKPEASSVTLD